MKILFVILLLGLSWRTMSQNLILNPSFEQNGQPYCEGWYDGCGSEFDRQCDSMAYCGTLIINESAPDGSNGEWCLKIYGGFPTSGFADSYVTGQTGTLVYQLKYWMNSEFFSGTAYLGPMKNRTFIDSNFIQDYGHPWTEYIILDTITTSPTDTIGVRLTADLGDFCICEVAFDQIELTVIDTLATSVKTPIPLPLHTAFPNPCTDKFNINIMGYSSFYVTIFDFTGKEIKHGQSDMEIVSIDLANVSPGLYFYQIMSTDHTTLIGRGKLVKD